MIGWLSKGSFGTQLAVLLTIALIAANAVAFGLLGQEHTRVVRNLRTEQAIERIAAVTRLANSRPRDREDLVRIISTEATIATVEIRPLVHTRAEGPFARRIVRAIAAELGTDDARVRVEPSSRAEPDSGRLILSLPLDDGAWLNIQASRERFGASELWLAPLALSLLGVLMVALFAAGRLTKPLSDLEIAAEAAGQGDTKIRLSESGPKEIRRVVTAFNAMQSAIAEFERDRATTVAALGHDLRTPITSLRLRAELVEDPELSQAMERTLDEMEVMADDLLRWGQETLVRSDSDNIGIPEKPGDFDLEALTKDICDQHSQIVYEGFDPIKITGRPVAMRRAISNVIENAVRYAGGATVRLSLRSGEAIVEVEDEGAGLPDESLAEVFEAFTRGDKARTPGEGSGLGLAIARKIIRADAGSISAANRASGGLVVTIRLPLAKRS